jgi:hypothetical protein
MRLAASKLPPLVLLVPGRVLERELALEQERELVPVLVLELALGLVLEPVLGLERELVPVLVPHSQQPSIQLSAPIT